MLMANSVEGRFPFLDQHVSALADSLPPRFKLRGLREKHVLKHAAKGLIPDAIIARQKQPYRAPDALSFVDPRIKPPAYVEEMLTKSSVSDAGIFEPEAIGKLWRKCKNEGASRQFSNADNMALVGVLSTQLLHHFYIRSAPQANRSIELTIDVDRARQTTKVHVS